MFKIEITNMKRYSAPDSQTKAFVSVALKGEDSTMFIENLTIKEITKDGKKKLIISYPSYKTGEQYRDIINIKGQLYWDLNNTILEEYMTTREVS